MIQVNYGIPTRPQAPRANQPRPGTDFRQTRQATNLLNYIDRFITYFERTKGHKPRSVLLRPEQLAALGVQPGTRRHGVALEVLS
jgi:hypothetical protein